MKFPMTFTRYKGSVPAGAIALASDAIPTTPPNPATMSNLFTAPFVSKNGWPVCRIGIVYNPPSGSTNLAVDVYLYEENLGIWFRANATSPIVLPPKVATYCDIPAPIEPAPTTANLSSVGVGSLTALLIVTDPNAAPNGAHQFAVCADLTTVGTN